MRHRSVFSSSSSLAYSLPLFISLCSSRNAGNEPFARLVSKHWAHLNIGFISLGVAAVCCCPSVPGRFCVSDRLCLWMVHLEQDRPGCGQQEVESLNREGKIAFMCHYNFDAYCSCYNNKQSSSFSFCIYYQSGGGGESQSPLWLLFHCAETWRSGGWIRHPRALCRAAMLVTQVAHSPQG